MVRRTGQVALPAGLRTDVSAHGFLEQGTTAMFYIRIFNLNMVFYLFMNPKNALAKAEKDKNDLYLQA